MTTVSQYALDGHYPLYVKDGDMELAKITGDWIRVPPGIKTVTFEYQATDTASPVGTMSIEETSLENPGATDGLALVSDGTTALDGIGAKHAKVSFNFVDAGNAIPRFIRALYTRSGGGAADLLQISASLA